KVNATASTSLFSSSAIGGAGGYYNPYGFATNVAPAGKAGLPSSANIGGIGGGIGAAVSLGGPPGT
ncbi:unnamed protein product, partial [Amoebophrya sp. A25]